MQSLSVYFLGNAGGGRGLSRPDISAGVDCGHEGSLSIRTTVSKLTLMIHRTSWTMYWGSSGQLARTARPRTNDWEKSGKWAPRAFWWVSPGQAYAFGTKVWAGKGISLPQALHLAQAKVPGRSLLEAYPMCSRLPPGVLMSKMDSSYS